MDRPTIARLYLALVGGLLGVMAVFGFLLWQGTAPLLRTPDVALIAIDMAVVASGLILIGLLWARPKVPRRARSVPVEAFWRDPEAGARALLLWVLWEGSAVISSVGTLLTGSLLTAAVGAAALGLLVTHSPGYLEGRETSEAGR